MLQSPLVCTVVFGWCWELNLRSPLKNRYFDHRATTPYLHEQYQEKDEMADHFERKQICAAFYEEKLKETYTTANNSEENLKKNKTVERRNL